MVCCWKPRSTLFNAEIICSSNMNWPSKEEREAYEINGFIEHYKKLPEGRDLVVLEKREKPDYLVTDRTSREVFGVELTSAYLSDISVPNEHLKTLNGKSEYIPFNRKEIEQFKIRLLEAVKVKVNKANTSYDLRYPLILSVYVNEYRSIFMDRTEWERFIKDNEAEFDAMQTFKQIFFWSLVNGDALLVTPNKQL